MYKVRARITGVAGSPYWINGFFDSTGVGAADAAVEWAKFIASASNGLPTGWSLTCGSEVQVVEPANGQVIDVEPIAPSTLAGTTNTPTGPRASQLLMRWKTNNYVNGRRVQGHTNIPITYTSDVGASGAVAGSTQTAWTNKINGLLTGPAGDAFVIWSRAAGEHFAVTNGSVWDQFSVLRSRRD